MDVITAIRINGFNGYEINGLPFTDNADELFDCGYTTLELSYTLANAISPKSDHPNRVAYLAEYNSGDKSPWVRGTICKALDLVGENVSRINRRKS